MKGFVTIYIYTFIYIISKGGKNNHYFPFPICQNYFANKKNGFLLFSCKSRPLNLSQMTDNNGFMNLKSFQIGVLLLFARKRRKSCESPTPRTKCHSNTTLLREICWNWKTSKVLIVFPFKRLSFELPFGGKCGNNGKGECLAFDQITLIFFLWGVWKSCTFLARMAAPFREICWNWCKPQGYLFFFHLLKKEGAEWPSLAPMYVMYCIYCIDGIVCVTFWHKAKASKLTRCHIWGLFIHI